MSEKIMIVEDDESIRQLLEVALQSHGYDTVSFPDAESALEEMHPMEGKHSKEEVHSMEEPSVVIIDIMLEGMDGIEAVRRMRLSDRLRTIPVILLTAKDSELDKIIGLDAGADDYMTKPFGVLELCARVRAQIRRKTESEKSGSTSVILEESGLCLNSARREVLLDGNKIELTFKEFELLKILMESQDRAISRMELIGRIWGEDYCGETRTLDIHIGTLRQKLGDTAENGRYIKTVRGIGYRFIGGDRE